MSTSHKLQHYDSNDLDSEHQCEINGSTMPLHKVLNAYAGLARAGKYYAPTRNLPSMAPVGLIGFGVPSMFLGLVLIGVRGITIPNLTICPAWFSGGVGLLTAGMWEFLLENSHGSAVMATYGLYWWSMAALYTPSFGIAEKFGAYCTTHVDKMPAEYDSPQEWALAMMTTAFGFWCLGYALFSASVVATLLKSTLAFFLCILFVMMIFICITIGYLGATHVMVQAAGGFSFAAGTMAIYNGMAGLMTKENSYVHIKPVLLPSRGPVHDPEH